MLGPTAEIVPAASQVLGAMITPALLISAAGTLALSTSNRLSRVVDRVRVLAQEAERLAAPGVPRSPASRAREQMIVDQLARLSTRALILRSAMTALYAAIGLLVATSIAVGLAVALALPYGWPAVVLGLGGAAALLWGSALLIREARLAVTSTLGEMAYVRGLVQPPGGAPG